MARTPRYQNRLDLLQGTLDFMILQTLRWGAQHGYGISHAINANSFDAFKVGTGSMYPALHRLEKRGWIKAEWRTSDNNQRAKSYLPHRRRPQAARHRTIPLEPVGGRDGVTDEAAQTRGVG